MNSGATPAGLFFGLCAALAGPGCDAPDPALDIEDSVADGTTAEEGQMEEDSEGTDTEPASPSAAANDDFAAASDPMAASWSCGGACPLFTFPVGVGCSSGCPGSCPNRTLCESIPAQDPEAEIWTTPSSVDVPAGTLGSTEVCWKTKHIVAPVWIRVRVDGGPGQLFTKESNNGTECEDAPWIQAGSSYQFTVHKWNADNAPALDSATATGVAGPATTGGDESGIGCGDCQSGWDCHCFDQCWPAGNACP